jgi:hypothetical protein
MTVEAVPEDGAACATTLATLASAATPDLDSPQSCLLNKAAVQFATKVYADKEAQHMSARQKKDLAWTCATQVNGLCTKSTVRGTAEILSFVFQVPFSYGMVQRALNAQALGETRRTRPGPRQKYPIVAEIELVSRIKAMRAQKLATYPSLIKCSVVSPHARSREFLGPLRILGLSAQAALRQTAFYWRLEVSEPHSQ